MGIATQNDSLKDDEGKSGLPGPSLLVFTSGRFTFNSQGYQRTANPVVPQAALGCFPEAEFELVPVVTIRGITPAAGG